MSNPGIWLGLLKWSLGQGDGTLPSEAHEMSAEDRQFLENVMKECVVDEPQRMQDIMKRFVELLNANEAANEENVDEIVDKLQELKDIAGQIDMAQIFVKYGGIECLLKLLELEPLDTDARCGAAAAFGTICQNNHVSQQAVFESGGLERLVNIFLNAESGALKAKVLYAISCLIRGHAAAEDKFVREFGERIFVSVRATPIHSNASLWTRALYLNSALLSSDTGSSTRTALIGPILMHGETILHCLRSNNVDTREAMIHFANTVINSIGGKLLVTPYRVNFEVAIAEREAKLRGQAVSRDRDDDSSKAGDDDEETATQNVEQLQHEIELLQDIIAQIDGRRRSNSASVTGGGSSSSSSCTTIGGVSSPNLLIGPGPVETAAVDPNAPAPAANISGI